MSERRARQGGEPVADASDRSTAGVAVRSAGGASVHGADTMVPLGPEFRVVASAAVRATAGAAVGLAVDADACLAVDAAAYLAVDADDHLAVDGDACLAVDAAAYLAVDGDACLAVDAAACLAVDADDHLATDPAVADAAIVGLAQESRDLQLERLQLLVRIREEIDPARLGYSHRVDFAREELHLGTTAFRGAVRLGRALTRLPRAREALRRGWVCESRLLVVLPELTGENEFLWVRRAIRRPVVELQALVREARRLRKEREERERATTAPGVDEKREHSTTVVDLVEESTAASERVQVSIPAPDGTRQRLDGFAEEVARRTAGKPSRARAIEVALAEFSARHKDPEGSRVEVRREWPPRFLGGAEGSSPREAILTLDERRYVLVPAGVVQKETVAPGLCGARWQDPLEITEPAFADARWYDTIGTTATDSSDAPWRDTIGTTATDSSDSPWRDAIETTAPDSTNSPWRDAIGTTPPGVANHLAQDPDDVAPGIPSDQTDGRTFVTEPPPRFPWKDARDFFDMPIITSMYRAWQLEAAWKYEQDRAAALEDRVARRLAAFDAWEAGLDAANGTPEAVGDLGAVGDCRKAATTPEAPTGRGVPLDAAATEGRTAAAAPDTSTGRGVPLDAAATERRKGAADGRELILRYRAIVTRLRTIRLEIADGLHLLVSSGFLPFDCDSLEDYVGDRLDISIRTAYDWMAQITPPAARFGVPRLSLAERTVHLGDEAMRQLMRLARVGAGPACLDLWIARAGESTVTALALQVDWALAHWQLAPLHGLRVGQSLVEPPSWEDWSWIHAQLRRRPDLLADRDFHRSLAEERAARLKAAEAAEKVKSAKASERVEAAAMAAEAAGRAESAMASERVEAAAMAAGAEPTPVSPLQISVAPHPEPVTPRQPWSQPPDFQVPPPDTHTTTRIVITMDADLLDDLRRAFARIRSRYGDSKPAWWCLEVLLLQTRFGWIEEDRDFRRRTASIEILERDGFTCSTPVCTSRRDLTVHHITFRSAGGSDDPENLITLCAACHLHGVHDRGTIRISRDNAGQLVWSIGDGRYRSDGRVIPGRQPHRTPPAAGGTALGALE